MNFILQISKRWLTDGRAYFCIGICAVMLTLPSVFTGFSADDYFLRSITLKDRSVPHLPLSPLDAFAFMKHDPQSLQHLIELGILPWWSHPQLRIAFWRPLSALTHWFDFHLFPDAAWLMHAHNILWYAGLGLVIMLFYRQLIRSCSAAPIAKMEGCLVAGIAALLYIMDDAHGMGVGWISNRNGIVGAVFGVGALLMHDRWRRNGWRPGALLAPVCLALGLLGGESAVAVCGYLFAYALFIDQGTVRNRCFSLLPCVIVTVAWRVIYTRLGYGVIGTSLYLDPGQNPALFLKELVLRLPVLLLGQLGIPNSAVWTLVPPFWASAVFVASLTFLSIAAWMLWPFLRRDPLARFFALGMVLSAVPPCATYPNDRLLFFTGIGGMGLVAQYLAQGMKSLQHPAHSFAGRPFRAERAMVLGLFLIHGILGPVMLPALSLTSLFFERPIQWGADSFPGPDKGQAVIVNLPIDMMPPYIYLMRAAQNKPLAADARLLSAGLTALEIEGVNSHTLIVRPQGGLLKMPWDQVFRDTSLPFKPGHTQTFKGLEIVVTKSTPDGRPAEIRYVFDKPLNDPSLQWVTWSGRRLVPFKPPVPGERILIKEPSLLWWL